MFQASQIHAIMLLATVGVWSGGGRAPASAEPEYSFGLLNVGRETVENARVVWRAAGADHHELFGVVGVADAGSMGAIVHEEPRPIPESATVEWTTADGKQHQQQVPVAALVPDAPGFSGTIYFKLKADATVTVVPLTYAEQLNRSVQGELMVP